MAKQTSSMRGVLLKERYLVEKPLGQGGIGAVYLARDKQLLARPVVIKVLLEEAAQNPWLKKKFGQEVEALARIDHPGVVGVLDAGEMTDGTSYIVMQFVEGSNLRSLMVPQRMDLERLSNILRQACHALQAAHDKGIYHRDLKPENIMVQTVSDGEEYIKLIDFGIATVKDSQIGTNKSSTMVAGSLSYMAPEQLAGKPSGASDIYALGVIIYEMVTGRMPFYADTLIQLYEMQKAGTCVKPRSLRPELPDLAERAILKALRFDPEDRFKRARDFSEDFAAGLSASWKSQLVISTQDVESQPANYRTTRIANSSASAVRSDTKPARLPIQAPLIQLPIRKTLSDYVSFARVFLLVVAIIGVGRLVLSIAGVENGTVKWFSMTAVQLIGLVYFSVRLHTSGFGSYKHLFVILFMQNLVAQSIIITGIATAIFTGRDNIFSAPEYSGGGDGKTWLHVGAHLLLGTTIGPLIAWLIGSVIMWVTKKVVRGEEAAAGADYR